MRDPITSADHWLDRYGTDHTHRVNKLLHWFCVPLIVIATVGLLWSLPVPDAFARSTLALNWGTVFLMAAVVYYFIMSINLAIGILPFIVLVAASVAWMDTLSPPLWLICAVIFVVGGLGQVAGHLYEGKHPSFVKDLHYLMIGPLWLLAMVYRRLRIPY